LERVRLWYSCSVIGYVIMPEHVHLLVSDPEGKMLESRVFSRPENSN
jgi:REP element-mobilizing transposase RayT